MANKPYSGKEKEKKESRGRSQKKNKEYAMQISS